MRNHQARRLRTYLFDGLLPLTRDCFVDRKFGGFHERLDSSGKPIRLGYKRLLVQCRQIYLLSHAALTGDAESLQDARQGVEFLQRYWDQQRGGWFLQCTLRGQPLDRTKDAYGHAFVLLAMAYFHRASQDPQALELAARTLGVLEEHFAEPVHGGFIEAADENWSGLPRTRRQNPHMHLLEGFLAIYQESHDQRYLAQAQRMVELFESHFFDADNRTLGEYFSDDWTRHPECGEIVEPGHHFEWYWLLYGYAQATGNDAVLPAAEAMRTWALKHGLDGEYGGVFDAVNRDGTVSLATKRIWPLLECIKASAIRYEHSRNLQDLELLGKCIDDLFQRHLCKDGRWKEHLDAEGAILNPDLPGTTGYHLFLGLSEALRVLETLE
ncbi:MAG: AGE family epimerase/isomerase [Planctomycetota bacterium]